MLTNEELRSKGIFFVTFDDEEQIQKAISENFNGQNLRVKLFSNKSGNDSRRGGYGGREGGRGRGKVDND